MRILGIDPGLKNTGFGVVEYNNDHLTYIGSGIITTQSSNSTFTRLKELLDSLKYVIQEVQPTIACVERIFINNNLKGSLLLCQARGTAIAALNLYDIPITEYTALQIKKSVCGYGHAAKDQVATMVKYLLSLNATPQKDAADALAIAIAHAHYNKICQNFGTHAIKKGRLIG